MSDMGNLTWLEAMVHAEVADHSAKVLTKLLEGLETTVFIRREDGALWAIRVLRQEAVGYRAYADHLAASAK